MSAARSIQLDAGAANIEECFAPFLLRSEDPTMLACSPALRLPVARAGWSCNWRSARSMLWRCPARGEAGSDVLNVKGSLGDSQNEMECIIVSQLDWLSVGIQKHRCR